MVLAKVRKVCGPVDDFGIQPHTATANYKKYFMHRFYAHFSGGDWKLSIETDSTDVAIVSVDESR